MYFEVASLPVILDDLCSRFIINVPDEELASVERICFQIEQAHWFYEDFIREINTSLPTFTLKNFSAKIFKHCPLLHQWAHEHEKAFNDFLQYKFRVPVCGAIILNETQDKCLLVKGWTSRSGWGFPRGKINKDEPDSACAIREVLEETGFDITPYLEEDQFIEVVIHEQRIKLFIATGIPESTVFVPMTRKEISKIEWHRISDLPTSKVKSGSSGIYDTPIHSVGGSTASKSNNRYYMIIPFVSRLKSWIHRRNKGKPNKQPSSLRSSRSSSRLSAADSQVNAENQIKSLLGMINGHSDVKEQYSGANGDYISHGQNQTLPHLARRSSFPNGSDPESMLKSMLRISGSTTSLPSIKAPSPPKITILKRNPDSLNNSAHASPNSKRGDLSINPRQVNSAKSHEIANSTSPMLAEHQLKSLLGISKPSKSNSSMPANPSAIDFYDRATQQTQEGCINSTHSMLPHSNSNSMSLLSLFEKPANSTTNRQAKSNYLDASPLLALVENPPNSKGKSPKSTSNTQNELNSSDGSTQSLLALLQHPSSTTIASQTVPSHSEDSAQSLLSLLQQPPSSKAYGQTPARHLDSSDQLLAAPFEKSPISTSTEQVNHSNPNASVQSLLALLGKSADSATSSQAEASNLKTYTHSLLSSPQQPSSATYSAPAENAYLHVSTQLLSSPVEKPLINSSIKSGQLSASAQSLLHLLGQPSSSTTVGQTELTQPNTTQSSSMLHEQLPKSSSNSQIDQPVSILPDQSPNLEENGQIKSSYSNDSNQQVLASVEKSSDSTTSSQTESSQGDMAAKPLFTLLDQPSNSTNVGQTETNSSNASTQSLLALFGKRPSISNSEQVECSQSLLTLLGKSPSTPDNDQIKPTQSTLPGQHQTNSSAQSLLSLLGKPPSSSSGQTESIQSNPPAQSLLALLGQPTNSLNNGQTEPNQPNSSAQSLLSLLSESSSNVPPNTSESNSNRRTSHTTINAANELLGFVSSQSPSQTIPESPKFEQSQMLKGMLGIDSVGQVKPKNRTPENTASSNTDHIKQLLNLDSTPTVA